MVGTGSWKTVALDACGNGMGQAKWVAETPRALLLRITFQSVFHIEQGPHMGRRIMAIDLDGIESIQAQMPHEPVGTAFLHDVGTLVDATAIHDHDRHHVATVGRAPPLRCPIPAPLLLERAVA